MGLAVLIGLCLHKAGLSGSAFGHGGSLTVTLVLCVHQCQDLPLADNGPQIDPTFEEFSRNLEAQIALGTRADFPHLGGEFAPLLVVGGDSAYWPDLWFCRGMLPLAIRSEGFPRRRG